VKKNTVKRYHVHLRPTETAEIDRILALDVDAKRTKLIREAVLAYREQYRKRIAYLEARHRQKKIKK